jgi:DIM1 family U5 snRNP protein
MERGQPGWHVDQAIITEEYRVVCIRFGSDSDDACMQMDEHLYKIVDKVKKFAVVYVCDTKEVPDFNAMYELYDPCTLMFFWRNKHIQVRAFPFLFKDSERDRVVLTW